MALHLHVSNVQGTAKHGKRETVFSFLSGQFRGVLNLERYRLAHLRPPRRNRAASDVLPLFCGENISASLPALGGAQFRKSFGSVAAQSGGICHAWSIHAQSRYVNTCTEHVFCS